MIISPPLHLFLSGLHYLAKLVLHNRRKPRFAWIINDNPASALIMETLNKSMNSFLVVSAAWTAALQLNYTPQRKPELTCFGFQVVRAEALCTLSICIIARSAWQIFLGMTRWGSLCWKPLWSLAQLSATQFLALGAVHTKNHSKHLEVNRSSTQCCVLIPSTYHVTYQHRDRNNNVAKKMRRGIWNT